MAYLHICTSSNAIHSYRTVGLAGTPTGTFTAVCRVTELNRQAVWWHLYFLTICRIVFILRNNGWAPIESQQPVGIGFLVELGLHLNTRPNNSLNGFRIQTLPNFRCSTTNSLRLHVLTAMINTVFWDVTPMRIRWDHTLEGLTTFEPGYNDISLHDTPSIASDILRYQITPPR
jgi:hypothetical protein